MMNTHTFAEPPLPNLSGPPVRAVLDTDTYNEMDDQVALTYTLLSKDRISLEACYAAPFVNVRAANPEIGMVRSYEEILNVLNLLGENLNNQVFHGSRRYMESPDTPVRSPAVDDLIARAMEGTSPLYVMAIAAPTNIASALVLEPRLRERIVVIWLGGHPYSWPTSADEFNMRQDPAASRVLFDSGVPLVHLPCKNVAEHLRTTIYEFDHYLARRNPLCTYLQNLLKEYVQRKELLSKPVWDIAAPAFLIQPAWIPTVVQPCPILTKDLGWQQDDSRHPVRIATDALRDPIFADLFAKLQAARIQHSAVPVEIMPLDEKLEVGR